MAAQAATQAIVRKVDRRALEMLSLLQATT
jgi:hypothetical protein